AVNKLDTNVNNLAIYKYARKIRSTGSKVLTSTKEQTIQTIVLPSKDIFNDIYWLLGFQHDMQSLLD
ncbi:MAG: hypothetical protein M3Z40_06675, partial [Bifidobacterium sp.]|nr:hypothetical protein [Bifidobacterium sp.]